jgi:cysteine-rich repeat protein
MNHRPIGPRTAAWPLALLLAAAATCFTGDELVDQPCQTDEDCNPPGDALGQPLRCQYNVCGYTQRCGDGIIDEALESCDDGAANVESDHGSGPGQCSASTCQLLPYCGDGEVDAPRESCDDANTDDRDSCPRTCKSAVCGDGFVGPGEACDPKADTDCTEQCARPTCGDGLLQGDEACDDGNTADDDECLNTCLKASCGDGVVWLGIEECDDKNLEDADECLGTCKAASCGDGITQAGVEQCDDANLDYLDACVDDCQAATCGDQFVHKGVEQCDDGNTEDNDDCTATCKHAKCGDGIKGPMEACDDGNEGDGDGCSAACEFESCGDGVVQGQEQCDDANEVNTDACVYCQHAVCGDSVTWKGQEQCDDGDMKPTGACPKDCKKATCGDGHVWAGKEQCDDGNADDADACLATCKAATCGDGHVWAGNEPCDDGNLIETDACLNGCVAAKCGDGVTWSGTEGCDDGNADHNDGCSNACKQGSTAIEIGSSHSCALRAGKVRCWGWGIQGKLGYGSTATIGDELADLPPDDVDVGGDVVQTAGGQGHTCALLKDKTVRCWGAGSMLGRGGFLSDDLGDGPGEMPPAIPVDLGGPAQSIVAGSYHTCALLEDDTIRCWGSNTSGQAGYAGVTSIGVSMTPKDLGPVLVGGPVKQITAEGFTTCALFKGVDDGKLRCWGKNDFGQLGLGHKKSIGDDEHPADAPFVDVGGPVTQVDAGYFHNCALLASGAVRCWGENSSGALGIQSFESIGDDEHPSAGSIVKMLAPGDIVLRVLTGNSHTCVLLSGGNVRCWGAGHYGALGYGNTNSLGWGLDETSPLVAVDAVPGKVRDLALGSNQTCALLDGGAVRCWGTNSYGQLALGHTATIGDGPDEMPPKDAVLYKNP